VQTNRTTEVVNNQGSEVMMNGRGSEGVRLCSLDKDVVSSKDSTLH
jgi:hypothetical protein